MELLNATIANYLEMKILYLYKHFQQEYKMKNYK